MSELRLSASATADFDEAADWYSTNDPEITERFIDAVNRTLAPH
jgi:plasmid stabilization system protein ParE